MKFKIRWLASKFEFKLVKRSSRSVSALKKMIKNKSNKQRRKEDKQRGIYD